MEPRIATLLGESSFDRATLEPISLLPPPAAPRRPHPVEPSPVGDDARTNVASHRSDASGTDQHSVHRLQRPPPPHRQKSGAPIAEVLNNESPVPTGHQALPSTSTQPFSGRLSDILLDPSQQHVNKRRRIDDSATGSQAPASENALLTLPKPPQLPKKTTKRPRIPPLLQGLHQPPPLPPEGRLFPPITGEGGSFGRELDDRPGLRSPGGPEPNNAIDSRANASNPSGSRIVLNGASKQNVPDTSAKVPAASISDKENHDRPGKHAQGANYSKVKEPKKRNKWSEQETKDLLVGVSRFGIGNWKKILQCSDFTFNQRTAVDLKDRFRVCCPGEGAKPRKPKPKKDSQDAVAQEPITTTVVAAMSEDQGMPLLDSIPAEPTSRKPRTETHKKGPAELAEMGIHGPFMKNTRRERREFTETDDENLLKGFETYGASWHAMRDDKSLAFESRYPTDLRDRFRIRYPEMYAKFGYKLKPKHETMLKEKRGEKERAREDNSSRSPGNASITKGGPEVAKPREGANVECTSMPVHTDACVKSNLRAHALRQPLLNSFPSPLQDFGDIIWDEDIDGSRSPVTLSADIFKWADANPLQTSTASTSLPPAISAAGDIPLNLFTGMDGFHINPLATFNLQMAPVSSNILSVMPTYPSASGSLMLSSPMNPPTSSGTNIPATSSSAASNLAQPSGLATATSISKQPVSFDHLLGTPNLPTIVFPHVPAASARGMNHNLPPPADLLSGMDLDMRLDG